MSLENQQQQQGQEQQPSTTCVRRDVSTALTAALWNCAADGAMSHNGHHLTEHQMTYLVRGVLAQPTPDGSVRWLADTIAQQGIVLQGIVLQGELPGWPLPARAVQHRLQRFVEAVRRGNS